MGPRARRRPDPPTPDHAGAERFHSPCCMPARSHQASYECMPSPMNAGSNARVQAASAVSAAAFICVCHQAASEGGHKACVTKQHLGMLPVTLFNLPRLFSGTQSSEAAESGSSPRNQGQGGMSVDWRMRTLGAMMAVIAINVGDCEVLLR